MSTGSRGSTGRQGSARPTNAAGRFLIVGIPGLRLDAETRDFLTELRPGGVILFDRNLESVDQVVELTAALHALLPDVLLWVDAEGGRVDRLRRVLAPAPAGEALALAPPRAAFRAGLWIGHGLRALGFDGNFAPVADLDHGLTGNALDGRCLGAGPRPVIARARGFLSGLHRAGIVGCLKHFPGLGAAPADTHHRAATVDLSRPDLERELEPFRRLGRAAGAVMVGHALYPAWDAERPASLSRRIATHLLREESVFDGLAVADDVEMEGLAPWAATPAERAEAAFAAGCDGVLICHRAEQALAAARRLAAPALAERREQAEDRWNAHRRHLARLRSVAAARTFGVATVRRKLAEMATAVTAMAG